MSGTRAAVDHPLNSTNLLTSDATLTMGEICCTQVFLVFGRTGWIGGEVGRLLEEQGATWEYATARLEDRAGILADIQRVRDSTCRRNVHLKNREGSNLGLCASVSVNRLSTHVLSPSS